jgi:hypothetical protein
MVGSAGSGSTIVIFMTPPQAGQGVAASVLAGGGNFSLIPHI